MDDDETPDRSTCHDDIKLEENFVCEKKFFANGTYTSDPVLIYNFVVIANDLFLCFLIASFVFSLAFLEEADIVWYHLTVPDVGEEGTGGRG